MEGVDRYNEPIRRTLKTMFFPVVAAVGVSQCRRREVDGLVFLDRNGEAFGRK